MTLIFGALEEHLLTYLLTYLHGVALVGIKDAGLKSVARGSLKIQDAKTRQKSPSGHHRTICRAISSQLGTYARIEIGKKLLSSNISYPCPHIRAPEVMRLFYSAYGILNPG